ncbi:MAG: hypothetical protein AAB453_04295 [Patescibacteria group bacterium]
MKYNRGNADLWWVLAVVAGMWVVWALSGGPDRASTGVRPFIEPPPPIGSGRTYGPAFKFFALPNFGDDYFIGGGKVSVIKSFEPDELDENNESASEPPVGNNSIYFEQVKIHQGNARYEYQPGKEFITLQANYRDRNSAPINLSGWYLKNGKDQRFTVPNYPRNKNAVAGISDFVAIPLVGNAPIILPDSGEVVVTTGKVYSGNSLPINDNFRVNKCSGYLEDLKNYNFYPALNTRCPNPEDEPGVNALDRECRDFVESYSSCRTPEFKKVDGDNYVDGRQIDLSRQCRDFMDERFNYNTCITRHSGDEDFFEDEWRVFLGRRWELWAEEDEVITLYDNFGKLVDELKY